MLIKRMTSGLAAVAMLVTAVPSQARGQDRAWHDGYDSGEQDGYGDGHADGYHRGHRDGYRQAWRDAEEEDADERHDVHDRPRCGRNGGTGGLIVGGLAGGLLGRAVARDRTAGALIGGGLGALAGRAIDRGSQRC